MCVDGVDGSVEKPTEEESFLRRARASPTHSRLSTTPQKAYTHQAHGRLLGVGGLSSPIMAWYAGATGGSGEVDVLPDCITAL